MMWFQNSCESEPGWGWGLGCQGSKSISLGAFARACSLDVRVSHPGSQYNLGMYLCTPSKPAGLMKPYAT